METTQMPKFTTVRRSAKILIAAVLTASAIACAPHKETAEIPATTTAEKGPVIHIQSTAQFTAITANSPDRLLMFDLYADWCRPCRILAPLIEEIARQNTDRVSVYKISVDKQPELADVFGVTGIPHVAFIKNKERVAKLVGLQPKEAYTDVIAQYAAPTGNVGDTL
jgi:thioredoxin 1